MEPLHSLGYFAPELQTRLVALGLKPGRMCYFAGRSAAMGAVSSAVVAATFYNFSPELVDRSIPQAWTLADPAAVVAARYDAIDDAWLRLLGAQVLASAEVAEAAELIRLAVPGARPEGRPLYAAWAEPASEVSTRNVPDLPAPLRSTAKSAWQAATVFPSSAPSARSANASVPALISAPDMAFPQA